MGTDRIWNGVRLRQVDVGVDPDAPGRAVRLPAMWDDGAAAALCALAPGAGRVSLPQLAQSWIQPIALRARAAGIEGLGERLHTLLLLRRGAPTAGVWRGAAEDAPGFILSLPAFHDPATGFDAPAYADAARTGAQAIRIAAPAQATVTVAMSGLADLLALLGLDYAGPAAREVAMCLAAVLRGQADAVFAGPQLDMLAQGSTWPQPPLRCTVPGLAEEAAKARALSLRCAVAAPCAGILPPGPVDALLGIETAGIAPAFAPVGPAGLTRGAHAWLGARGISVEDALAAALAQEPVFPVATWADHAAMHDSVAGMVHAMPARPSGASTHLPANDVGRAGSREDLPARCRGYTQKAAVGGHRVFLRTGEYDDGRLGEIGLSLPREGAAVRGLADCFAAAVSLGLQHGIPLDRFVDLFIQQRFLPAGAVDGDPAVGRAASIPDYVFRSLAASYLAGAVAPALEEEPEPIQASDSWPLLPLDLPLGQPRGLARSLARGGVRRTALRLVG